ncbi:outer membrane protein assembly factor BamD [Catenovulum sp. SM1970]|uniref:outer membrane protein assembly factor BamD n=1 Tax=Marinifaba aquimaris TaxID=2741323 RepID=UPI0015731966|nr:outer membrane protein assembly factor BamD [Marinifaba aquimaris]NTS78321.1 outer membrane protein assembly factor BamD [Marinifaba aquimaris]
MTLNKSIIVSILSMSLLIGCSSAPEEVTISNKTTVQEQYESAKELLESGAYFQASEILAELDSRYPFGPHSHQIQLDLIYAYYKMAKSAQAIASIDRFIRLNPTHQNIAYVHYMRGLVNYQMAQNAFQELFGIERFDRDISKLREAFNDFKTVIVDHPTSKYANDAKQRMVYLKDFMAKTEIAAAEYYIERSAWAAAANRAKYVLETFSDTHQIERALEIMVESYGELELDTLRANTLATLKTNFPNNPLVN